MFAAKAWEKSPLPTPHDPTVPDMSETNRSSCYYVIKSVNSLCRTALFAASVCRFIHLMRHPCGVVALYIRGAGIKLMPMDTCLEILFQLPEATGCPYTLEDMAARTLEEQLADS